MVLTDEERRERKAQGNKKYYEANKEEIIKKQKAYREPIKEKIAERVKVWSKTPIGKKSQIKASWKRLGIINDDYDSLYDSYLQATHCNVCKSEFKDSYDRNLDHDHDTGFFRQFLCRACNGFDRWKLKVQNAS